MTTMSEVAIKGLDVTTDGGVVRVQDGQDTWLCWEAEWDLAVARLAQKDAADDDDAYGMLCDAVRGPVASLNGTSRGQIHELVSTALCVGLISEDMRDAYLKTDVSDLALALGASK